jgi:hypothetical protein
MSLEVDALKIDGLNGILKAVAGDVSVASNSDIQSLIGFTPVFPYNNNGVTCAVTAIGAVNIAGVADRLDFLPFCPNVSFTSIAFNVIVTTEVVASKVRIVVYSSVAGYPTAKLYESPDLDCETTGTKEHVTSFNFVAGTFYWVGVHSNSTATLRGIGTGGQMALQQNTGGTLCGVMRVSATFGAIPTPLDGVTAVSSTIPTVTMRT